MSADRCATDGEPTVGLFDLHLATEGLDAGAGSSSAAAESTSPAITCS
ncbi:MAG: hypothetical protein R2789_04530 [Microthrixaceae bacterium]